MLSFLLRSENLPFSVALAVMVGIAVLEVISALFGMALSGFLDEALPDGGVDTDADAATGRPFFGALADWFGFGQAPTLALVVVFLLTYGLSGWGVQAIAQQFLGYLFNPWVAGIPAVLVGFLGMNLGARAFRRVGLGDETSAVSADSLIGHTATIILGETRLGHPSQAKLRDGHGQAHYVLVEPRNADDVFPAGASVTLLERQGAKYLVVANTVEALFAATPPTDPPTN